MKKRVLILAFVLLGAGSFVFAQVPLPLSGAVADCARQLEQRMSEGSVVAVLNFKSDTPRLSEYVINEMMRALVTEGHVTVVERSQLDMSLIQGETAFQYSGEVDDATAQSIGKKAGAQAIITGDFQNFGMNYEINFKVLNVESAQIIVMPRAAVARDNTTTQLLAGAPPVARPVQPQPAAPSQQQAAGAAAILQPSVPQRSAADAIYPHGLYYSTGTKLMYGVGLNLVAGLGSFAMGDMIGGSIVGLAEATGILLMVLNVPGQREVTKYNTEYVGTTRVDTPYTIIEDTGSQGVFIAGAAIAAAGVIYGWFRPFSYDKSLAEASGTWYADAGNPMNNIGIQLVRNERGSNALSITYSLQF